MPPAKRNPDDVQTLKEKLHGAHAIAATNVGASGNTNAGAHSNATANASANARGRRTAQPAASSALKEVDNASTNSGHTATDANSSHMKWASQDPAVLQSYRRAYRLDTPSTFHNPLSHVVLGHGIGRLSPTMARPKAQRRVHKDQLALAVRKNFNALGVSESDVIVDWLYKTKHQGTLSQPPCRRGPADAAEDNEFRVRFAPQRR